GTPKGALVRHVREVEVAPQLAAVLDLTPDDVTVFVVPVSHAFGLTCLLATLATGGTAVLVESSYSPQKVLDAVERHGATILHGSPALFRALLRARAGGLPPSLRAGFVAGALAPPELLDELAGIRDLY